MKNVQVNTSQIWDITPENFDSIALEVFRYQAENIPVYAEFLQLLDVNPSAVNRISDIPFLPVELFKTHNIIPPDLSAEILFNSSGTTGSETSTHYVADAAVYQQSIRRTFELFFGDPGKYCILALLPSYLERNSASLVYMVNYLMQLSGNSLNGFFLNDHSALQKTIIHNETKKIPTLLIGVSFALLDFAEKCAMPLHHTHIIETGGMKGRRAEITRQELHSYLQQAFALESIYSEYGMTELLSQSYSLQDGIFYSPPWKRILIRDADDPLHILETDRNGLINIIDLANIYSCSFIATSDTGKLNNNGGFIVSGRFDKADIRGCNLLVL